MKEVSKQESSDNGICQNPLFASTLLNTVAPNNWARISSTPRNGCVSRNMLSLRSLRSTQILTVPDCLGTTTIPEHQGVDSVTLDMTPALSMRPTPL